MTEEVGTCPALSSFGHEVVRRGRSFRFRTPLCKRVIRQYCRQSLLLVLCFQDGVSRRRKLLCCTTLAGKQTHSLIWGLEKYTFGAVFSVSSIGHCE
jgi:hypothetical protein